MKMLAIDGNSIMNRAFYGIRLLSNKQGVYTNAIFGFLNILQKLIKEVSPTGVVVAFDMHAPTFRAAMYQDYKAGRKPMPEELRMQMPIIKELLALMGYHVAELEGFEGDDILGTLAKMCQAQGAECVISSGDRDNLQLIDKTVTVALATTKETIVYDTARFEHDYGFSPIQLIDLKAIMGDSSDNIPGVKGIGEKTATALIKTYGTLEYIYDHLDEIDIKPGVRTKLRNSKQIAFLSKELATIKCDVPLDKPLSTYENCVANEQALAQKLVELELHTFIQKFGLQQQAALALASALPQSNTASAQTIQVQQNPSLSEFTAWLDRDTIYFYTTFSEDMPTGLYVNCEDKAAAITIDVAQYLHALLQTNKPKLYTTELKQLYRYILKSDLPTRDFAFDASLAGYLLNSSAKEYTVDTLCALYAPCYQGPEAKYSALLAFSQACYNLEQELIQKKMDKLLTEVEMPLSEVLASMELVGFMVDKAGIEQFGIYLQDQIDILTAEIYRHAGETFNINSTKELGTILFDKLGLPSHKKTKTGYSTSAEVLESLFGKHEIIAPILEYRKLTKLNSTYVVGLLKVIQADGRVHSIFKQTETRTGRISSTEPNMQNIPIRTELGSKMRAFFVAKEGYTLLDADYSQIELRLLAHIANDRMMIDAFNTGVDIHAVTASEVFDVPQLLMTPQVRSRAKAINFGIVYGISAFSLSQDIHSTVAEAKQYIEQYFHTYNGVKRYLDEVVKTSTETGFVTTMFGRRRDLPELRASNKILRAAGERIAMNTPIQGSAADIIKIAMVKVYQRIKQEQLDANLILQVHDELLIEVNERDALRAQMILKEEMENACKLRVTLQADVHQGKNWLAAK